MPNWNEMGRSWKEIAMDVIAEKDRRRFDALIEELDHALTAQLLRRRPSDPALNNRFLLPATKPQNAYEKIVDVAVAVMRSDYASVQMLYPDRGASGELRLLSFRGFNPAAAKFWEWVRADSKSTCGIALSSSQRVIAPDIAGCDFMADSEDQQVYLETGIHACQTTPLISRTGNVVGMISTHWRTPHQPSADDFRRFDVLAKRTADLIEQSRNPKPAGSYTIF
jgi:GAF domain-containing protein